MMVIRQILIFVAFLFLQVFLFNSFTLLDTEIPQVFILFLIMLPWNIPFSLYISIAFTSGIIIDLLSSNLLLGGHAFSCVLMAATRVPLMRIVTSKVTLRGDEEFDLGSQPVTWYIPFLGSLIFIHSLAYHIVDAFSLSNFHFTFLYSILGAVYTLILCFSITLLFYRNSTR